MIIIFDLMIIFENGVDLGFNTWVWYLMPFLNRSVLSITTFVALIYFFKRASVAQKNKKIWMRLMMTELIVIIIINSILIVWAVYNKNYNALQIKNLPLFKDYSEFLLDARDQCDSVTWLINSIFQIVCMITYYLFIIVLKVKNEE